jgi:nucleoside-diphosphate-sugar epimerase
MKNALVLGGTGLIGRSLVPELLANDWDVTVASRTPPASDLKWTGEVEHFAFDRETGPLDDLIRRDFNVLIDVVAYEPDAARQLIEIGDRVGSLVVISSVSVYADERGRSMEAQDPADFPYLPEPIPETQPTVEAGTESYSSKKVAIEEQLTAESSVPVTIVRAGMISGPGDGNSREWFLVKRVLDGRHKLPLAYEGAARFSVISARNLAELIRLAAEKPSTRIVNGADPVPQSARSIAASVGRILDHEWDEVLLEGDPHGSVGETPWTAPRSFVVDIERAKEELGYQGLVDYESALRETCDWLISVTADSDWRQVLPNAHRLYVSLFDYEREDEFLSTNGRL